MDAAYSSTGYNWEIHSRRRIPEFVRNSGSVHRPRFARNSDSDRNLRFVRSSGSVRRPSFARNSGSDRNLRFVRSSGSVRRPSFARNPGSDRNSRFAHSSGSDCSFVQWNLGFVRCNPSSARHSRTAHFGADRSSHFHKLRPRSLAIHCQSTRPMRRNRPAPLGARPGRAPHCKFGWREQKGRFPRGRN